MTVGVACCSGVGMKLFQFLELLMIRFNPPNRIRKTTVYQ